MCNGSRSHYLPLTSITSHQGYCSTNSGSILFVYLELHLVWSLSMSEAEVGRKVCCKHIGLLDLGEDWLVDGFLV